MPEEHRENFFTELLKFTFIAAVIVIPIRLFVAQPFFVSGASMVPTFQNGQYLIVDELTYHFEDPKRGEVVIFRYPKDPSQFFIKRIIGLPGETVTTSDTSITITKKDGSSLKLNEPYIVHRGNGGTNTYTIPAGQYFVAGDNRPESSDSRSWGTVPRANIIGRAFLRLLPIETISVFPGKVAQAQ